MRPRTLLLVAVAVIACPAVAWTAFAPIHSSSRTEIFEIPRGTYARRMSGTKIEILPANIRLTLGLRDVLVLRNHDVVPQLFGPTLMMPGQSFELPFQQASTYQFSCTAHLNGQLTIIVEPYPSTPWAKLRWRTREWLNRVSASMRT